MLGLSQPSQEGSIFWVHYIKDVVNFESYEISFDSIAATLSGNPINSDLVLVYPITGVVYVMSLDGSCVSSSINAIILWLLHWSSKRETYLVFIYVTIIIVNYGYMNKERMDHLIYVNEMFTKDEVNNFPLVTVIISMLI